MPTLLRTLAPFMGRRPTAPVSRTARRRESAGPQQLMARLVPPARHTVGVSLVTQRYLLYVVLPLWLGAGFFDYIFHRRTKIEQTAGARESLIHLLMLTESGVPLVMALLFEVNALTLLLMTCAFLVHEATAYWDVNYAETRRTVTPNEQHTHSFLEVIPFMALSMTACLNWDQFLALVGAGPERPDFRLRFRRHASRRYIVSILAAATLFGGVPHMEELIRCLRARPTLAPQPEVTSQPVGNLGAAPVNVAG